MRLHILFVIVLCISLKGIAKDADSLDLLTRIQEVNEDSKRFLYDNTNPINKFMFHDYTIYEANSFFSWQPHNQNFKVAQMGQGEISGGIDVNTIHVFDKNTKFYGGALYKNREIFDVKYNEMSDFEYLYPYVMGDSLGGDLKEEIYLFNLGYVKKIEHFLIGGEFNYTARHSFRNVDPRPRNITSDLSLKVSVGYEISSKYTTALTIGYNKYAQTSTIKFYSELGGIKIYHYLGLGGRSKRFSGLSSSAFFRGNSWDFNLNLIPKGNKNFSARIGYKIENLEKLLTDVQDIVLNELKKEDISAEIGYLGEVGKSELGGKLSANIHRRTGMENLFGQASTDNYPLIGSTPAFKLNSNIYSGTLIWNREVAKNLKLSIEPSFQMNNMEINRLTSQAKWSEQRYGGKLSLGYRQNRFWGTISVQGNYKNVSKESFLNLETDVINDFTPLITDGILAKVEVSIYQMIGKRVALNFKTMVYSESYKGVKNYFQLQHTLGIVF